MVSSRTEHVALAEDSNAVYPLHKSILRPDFEYYSECLLGINHIYQLCFKSSHRAPLKYDSISEALEVIASSMRSREVVKRTGIIPFYGFTSVLTHQLVEDMNTASIDTTLSKPVAELGTSINDCVALLLKGVLASSFEGSWSKLLNWYLSKLRGWESITDYEKSWANMSDEEWSLEPDKVALRLAKIMDFPDKQSVGPSPANQLKRVRAFFLGHGGVGKTSLIKTLLGESMPTEHQVTRGIQASFGKFRTGRIDEDAAVDALLKEDPKEDLTVHYWDFGGQVMAHALHKFFLRSSCVYVIVLCARADQDATLVAEYWLDFIRAFAGDDARVLLVGNKADIIPIELDLSGLKKKHPNIFGFYSLSCAHAKGLKKPEFEVFERDFFENVRDVANSTTALFPSEVQALRQISQRSKFDDIIGRDELNSMLLAAGVDRDLMDGTLQVFDNLGITIDLGLPFDSKTIIYPRWLTHGIYSLLYSDVVQSQHGRVLQSQIQNILCEGISARQGTRPLVYSPEACGTISSAMTRFEVAYEITSPGVQDRKLIIPSLLPIESPEHSFPLSHALAFRFQFSGLIPPQLLPHLIVRHNADLVEKDGNQLVWRSGAILETSTGYQTQALLRVDERDRVLEIYATGTGRADYIGRLRESARNILSEMPDLDWREELRLDPDAAALDFHHQPTNSVWSDYANVEAARLAGMTRILAGGYCYRVKNVLQNSPSAQELVSADVFISYERSDVEHVEAISKVLNRAGIKNWWDRHLPVGSKYRDDIGVALGGAKVVIVIWSETSANKDWVRAEAAAGSERLGLANVIGLRVDGFDPKRVPLPFGETNIGTVDDTERLLAALRARGIE